MAPKATKLKKAESKETLILDKVSKHKDVNIEKDNTDPANIDDASNGFNGDQLSNEVTKKKTKEVRKKKITSAAESNEDDYKLGKGDEDFETLKVKKNKVKKGNQKKLKSIENDNAGNGETQDVQNQEEIIDSKPPKSEEKIQDTVNGNEIDIVKVSKGKQGHQNKVVAPLSNDEETQNVDIKKVVHDKPLKGKNNNKDLADKKSKGKTKEGKQIKVESDGEMKIDSGHPTKDDELPKAKPSKGKAVKGKQNKKDDKSEVVNTDKVKTSKDNKKKKTVQKDEEVKIAQSDSSKENVAEDMEVDDVKPSKSNAKKVKQSSHTNKKVTSKEKELETVNNDIESDIKDNVSSKVAKGKKANNKKVNSTGTSSGDDPGVNNDTETNHSSDVKENGVEVPVFLEKTKEKKKNKDFKKNDDENADKAEPNVKKSKKKPKVTPSLNVEDKTNDGDEEKVEINLSDKKPEVGKRKLKETPLVDEDGNVNKKEDKVKVKRNNNKKKVKTSSAEDNYDPIVTDNVDAKVNIGETVVGKKTNKKKPKETPLDIEDKPNDASEKKDDNSSGKKPKAAKRKVKETPSVDDDEDIVNNDEDKVEAKRNNYKRKPKDSSTEDNDEPILKRSKTDETDIVSKDDKKKAPLKNKASTDYEAIDFSNHSKTSKEMEWNFKIANWNVDGVRAWLAKGGLDYIKYEKPDILCLQEIKCSQEKMPEEVVKIPGYHTYYLCSQTDGYAGVAICTSDLAMHVEYGLGNADLDSDGRIITAEYEQFFLVSTYVPNAGRKLVTMPKRLKWNEEFRKHVKKLDEKKPVIICGDMNVAHNEIDLTNPKTNKKNAGFTDEERAGMTELLGDGFVDTFRHLYPDKKDAYTFWTYMMNSRAKNVGWRLDYFIMSERLLPSLCDNVIRSQVFGSDHCPISLFLHLTSVGKPKVPH